jgi:hypothetical protein
MKTCPSCGVEKDASEFGKNKRRKDGLAFYCRDCSRRTAREFARTPAQQKKRRAYAEANKEYFASLAKDRWRTKRDAYEPARQKWAEDNRDKMLTYYADKGAAHRAFVDEIKHGKPCLDCHRIFAPYVMEFDHVRGKKRHSIGKMANHSRERVLEEIAKCELVCCVCHRIRSHARRAQPQTPKLIAFRDWLNGIKDKPCLDCHRKFAPEAMDFDHVRGVKISGITQMWSWGRGKVLAEIAKCEIVCANCHRERSVLSMRRAA